MTTCIVGSSKGSTNISHNSAVAHGNVKGRIIFQDREMHVAMTSKSSLNCTSMKSSEMTAVFLFCGVCYSLLLYIDIVLWVHVYVLAVCYK